MCVDRKSFMFLTFGNNLIDKVLIKKQEYITLLDLLHRYVFRIESMAMLIFYNIKGKHKHN